MKNPTFVCLHHTAVSYDKNKDQFSANNLYHKSQWNFKSSLGYYLGYNYEIAKNGDVKQAREDGEATAACYQENMNDGRCIHIALDGNFDTEKPQANQIYALRDLVRKLVKEHGIKKENIVFHNHYAPKSCPGNNLDLNFVRSFAYPDAVVPEGSTPDTSSVKDQIIKLLQNAIELLNKL